MTENARNARTDAAILIGSGSSLNAIDLSRLAGWPSISVNRAWIACRQWGFTPTFYACLDAASLAVVQPDLPRIVEFSGLERLYLCDIDGGPAPRDPRITRVRLEKSETFARMSDSLADFGNVGASALQLLWRHGAMRILTVGVDASYELGASVGADTSHFDAGYAVTPPPCDHTQFVEGWSRALAECSRVGIEVWNASPGTRLTACPNVSLERGLEWLTA